MSKSIRSIAPALLTGIALSLSLSACSVPTNRSLESVHQAVVSHSSFALDLATGPGGLSSPEQTRLDGWFEAMDLRYGDRIAIDDPLASAATRASIGSVAGHYGIIVGGDSPVSSGALAAGTVRVIITRAVATVPGCPDWSAKADSNLLNATSSNYGCAANSNLAAMVADPEHLIHGAKGSSESSAQSVAKAIDAFHSAKPTGGGALKGQATTSGS